MSLKLGLIGSKLSHSISPQIQKAGLEYLALAGSYDKFEIANDKFEASINELFQQLNGFNITIPYKEKILAYANIQDDLVKRIGAANTVKINNSSIHAFNTDYFGFQESLKDFTLKDQEVSVLGAGGASKAILVALDDMGVSQINIFVRNLDKAKDTLPKFVNCKHELKLHSPDMDISESKLVVNCTPVGQGRLADELSLAKNHIDSLAADAIVYDLIYEDTKLLQHAASRGLKIINGLEMLILQGVKSLSIWTERDIDKGLIAAFNQAA